MSNTVGNGATDAFVTAPPTRPDPTRPYKSSLLTFANADTREDSFATLGQIIDAGLWASGERHDVVRRGEREPIPSHVRSAVWYRDKGRCELCQTRSIEGAWHLDHITPWSAGGSDHTTNLRVLCEAHNMGRSNMVDPTERPRRAATWWCYRCYGRDAESWDYSASGLPLCPIHRNPKHCPVMRGYLRVRELTGEMPSWHQRPFVAEAATIAYCAHCNIPSLTDQPL